MPSDELRLGVLVLRAKDAPVGPVVRAAPGDRGGAPCEVSSSVLGDATTPAAEEEVDSLDELCSEAALALAAAPPEEPRAAAPLLPLPPLALGAALVDALLEVESRVDCPGASAAGATVAGADFAGNGLPLLPMLLVELFGDCWDGAGWVA